MVRFDRFHFASGGVPRKAVVRVEVVALTNAGIAKHYFTVMRKIKGRG